MLLKERNLLQTERAAARAAREKFLNPQRLAKARFVVATQPGDCAHAVPLAGPQVRKSMARIKLVLTERAIEEARVSGDLEALEKAKALINQL